MEIAVISGKGGTGKSSISAALATLNEKVILADCDVDAANLFLIFDPTHDEERVYIAGETAVIDYDKCTNCGICYDHCRFDAIFYNKEDKVEILETSCDGCRLCATVCPEKAITMVPNDKSRWYFGDFRNGKMLYGRLYPGEENSGLLVAEIRKKAKQMAEEEKISTTIIDGPPGIGCAVIASITGVDQAIVVTEPSMSALSDLKRTIELLEHFKLKSWVLINKFDLNLKLTKDIEEFCSKNNIDVLDKIAFNKDIVDAMVNKQSIIEYAPNSEISKQISEIYSTIKNYAK
ncbi:MAG: P-loop NTPase [Bacteroidales bacterium]|nr:P-loop NTPase [Bacteroidales bacterium]